MTQVHLAWQGRLSDHKWYVYVGKYLLRNAQIIAQTTVKGNFSLQVLAALPRGGRRGKEHTLP